MGEAKWRKANDPLFGKVPQSARRRGLVVSPPMHIADDHIQIVSSHLDKQELRFALLFWDELVWPTSNMIRIEGGEDEQFLEHEGLLKRPQFTVWGHISKGLESVQFQAFEQLEAAEPGAWAMAQGERSFHLLGGSRLSDGNGVTVQLHRAIPIPSADVPLAEILEFKRRRNDELIQLRYHLEAVKDGVSNAAHSQEALLSGIAAIDKSCSDLLKCGSEWQFPMQLSDLDYSLGFNPISMFGSASTGWYLGQPFGMPAAALAAGAMALASSVNINRSIGFRSIRRPASPFRYSYLAHQELI